MQQLSFALQNQFDFTEENFLILPENSSAHGFLDKFFAQENFSNAQFPALIITGAPASGKTHLLNIFAQKFSAEFLQLDSTSILQKNHFYIVENIEKITDEEALFHLINSVFVAKSFLIFSSAKKPQFKLKDLQSRIQNIVNIEIENPQPSSIEMLLVNRFGRKQLNVSSRIINFIATTISRNYSTINHTVELIEKFCFDHKKSPTLKEISELILLRS